MWFCALNILKLSGTLEKLSAALGEYLRKYQQVPNNTKKNLKKNDHTVLKNILKTFRGTIEYTSNDFGKISEKYRNTIGKP